MPIFEAETHLFIKGFNPNFTQWIFHGEDETFDVSDEDDIGDEVIPEEEYIDDMQHMLDDIKAGTFVDVSQDSTPTPTRPPIPDASLASSFDQLLEDA